MPGRGDQPLADLANDNRGSFSSLYDLDEEEEDPAAAGRGTGRPRSNWERRALAGSSTWRSLDRSFRAFYVKGRRRFGKWRALTPVLVLGGMTALMALLFLRNLTAVLHFLEYLATVLRGMGFAGYVVCAVMCFVLCFPPTVGYSTTVMFCGFTFGFPMGFFPAYLGSLAGATCCFMLARRWLQDYVVRTVKGNATLEAVIQAVEMKGFRLLLLIRLAPYPFTISNVMFSGTGVPLAHFVSATSVSLLKTALHVYVGSTLESITRKKDASSPPSSSHSKTAELVGIVAGALLAVGVSAYLFVVARRAVEETLFLQRDAVDVESDLEAGRLIMHAMEEDGGRVECDAGGEQHAQVRRTSRERAGRAAFAETPGGSRSHPNR